MNCFLSDKQSIVNSNFDKKLCLTLFAFAYFNKTSSSFWFFFDIILTNLYGFSCGSLYGGNFTTENIKGGGILCLDFNSYVNFRLLLARRIKNDDNGRNKPNSSKIVEKTPPQILRQIFWCNKNFSG